MQGRSRAARRPASSTNPELATREQLLIAAGELMVERGSTDVSLSDIAVRSGLNSALVKYYFGNKAGLMLALLRKVLGPALTQLQHLLEMDLSPEDKLRVHISGMINAYFEHPYVNRLMHQLLSEDATTFGPLIAEEFSKPVAEAQKRILEEGMNARVFRAVDPLLFYFQVVGACDQLFYGRYQLEHIFGVTTVTSALKRRFVDHLYNVVLEGILLRPQGDDACARRPALRAATSPASPRASPA